MASGDWKGYFDGWTPDTASVNSTGVDLSDEGAGVSPAVLARHRHRPRLPSKEELAAIGDVAAIMELVEQMMAGDDKPLERPEVDRGQLDEWLGRSKADEDAARSAGLLRGQGEGGMKNPDPRAEHRITSTEVSLDTVAGLRAGLGRAAQWGQRDTRRKAMIDPFRHGAKPRKPSTGKGMASQGGGEGGGTGDDYVLESEKAPFPEGAMRGMKHAWADEAIRAVFETAEWIVMVKERLPPTNLQELTQMGLNLWKLGKLEAQLQEQYSEATRRLKALGPAPLTDESPSPTCIAGECGDRPMPRTISIGGTFDDARAPLNPWNRPDINWGPEGPPASPGDVSSGIGGPIWTGSGEGPHINWGPDGPPQREYASGGAGGVNLKRHLPMPPPED